MVPFREACINFMELCKQKNEDRFWMDQVAAMQACPPPELPYSASSGIILAGEDNDPNQNMMINVSQNALSGALSKDTTSNGSLDAKPGMVQCLSTCKFKH